VGTAVHIDNGETNPDGKHARNGSRSIVVAFNAGLEVDRYRLDERGYYESAELEPKAKNTPFRVADDQLAFS